MKKGREKCCRNKTKAENWERKCVLRRKERTKERYIDMRHTVARKQSIFE